MKGAHFLVEATAADQIFTPEDFTAEHRDIAQATAQFWAGEVAPHLEAIQHQDHDVAVRVLRKSAELGLTAVMVPEEYGGMELDLISAMVVAEGLSKDGSYAGWHGAHAGIGTLPVLLFGTEAQKRKYLPRLASAELVGAYALTEAHAGSDALAARTRAELSADGTHYALNGAKMWITNAGKADLFTVFAKIGGARDKFTAFLVERSWAGVSVGAEEKKMGIKGSSTCAVYFDDVTVPAENVLGEIGRGHIIAFNILNLGRLKLGPFAVGGSKNVLQLCLKYAKEREAFGGPIARFGVIQHKLAEMAIRIFATEAVSYRVAGDIEKFGDHLKGAEEFAIECSYVKVFASEALDYVVDEGVQIHGGYGYHQDYAVERAYRDSRINRIFEGTNEINRLLATAMLLKRAQRGQVRLDFDPLAGPGADLTANAKQITLLALGVAYQRHLNDLAEQQEICSALADCAMETYAMESVALRAGRLGGLAGDMRDVFLRDAMRRVETHAGDVISASVEGDDLRTRMAMLRRLAKFEPVNAVAARRRIAARMGETGRYLY